MAKKNLSEDTYYAKHREERRLYYLQHRDVIQACQRRWVEKHRGRKNEFMRNWGRKYRLNGKTLQVEKRSYPVDSKCELCHEVRNKSLSYHHWDDLKPHIGVWCCTRCHRVCEALDYVHFQSVSKAYRRMKKWPERI
jgi:hypothetical protein